MKNARLWLAMGLFTAIFVAGCGTTTTTPPAGSGGNTATPAAASGLPIKTGTATINNQSVTVLTNKQGLTLYYRTDETPTTTQCNGGCLSVWPPLLASNGATPTSSATLTGQLTVLSNTSRPQVEYNGHALYTYASDTAPGQANGQGIGNVWYAATPSLAASSSPGGATPTPSGPSPTPTPTYLPGYGYASH